MPRFITARTNKGEISFTAPTSIHEVTVEVYQSIIREWEHDDWLQLFSLLCKQDIKAIGESHSDGLETMIYQTIDFFLHPDKKLEDYEVPKVLELRPVWIKDYLDGDSLIKTITIPKDLGRLSVAQAMQARKSLEGLKDVREGISMVTAIYLQPLVDNTPFDMLRAIELERLISQMRITHIFPIGFFLFRRLQESGTRRINVWSRIKNFLRIKNVRILLRRSNSLPVKR